MRRLPVSRTLYLLFSAAALHAQPENNMQQIMERLDRLEEANRALTEEIHALRGELAASAASRVDEKVAVQDRRIEEQAQTKVEASQKFPIRITGMALFNAFLNSNHTGGSDNPVTASLSPGPATAGATVRQTVIGLDFRGPQTLWQGKVSGSVYMDFFGGTDEPYDDIFHIRTARIDIDWNTRSLMVGQEKPLIAPRDPNSLARVGVSPLTGAGNLWFWQPQVRFEQRFQPGENTKVRAQIAVFQTLEEAGSPPYGGSPAPDRPGIEGRLAFSHSLDDSRRFEIAPGFHASSTHVAGTSVPSDLVSIDGFANPWKRLEFSGAFFSGRDVSPLGTFGPGYIVTGPGNAHAVHAQGGWGQLTFLATNRLSFNLFAGLQNSRARDLPAGSIGRNDSWAANAMYHLAPNVIVALEALQLRTNYLTAGTRLNNHYDLAVAYLF